jgi:hypothetical protein
MTIKIEIIGDTLDLAMQDIVNMALGHLGRKAEKTAAPPVDNDHVADGAQKFTDAEIGANAPTRERGQPSPGKSRRTKAEIAEDEAADKAEADLLGAVDSALVDAGFTKDEPAAISTGEERVGPEDDAETVAQDEADEKAETEAARDPEKPLTLDDVRGALGAYVKAYGMDAAQADGPKVLKLVCGENCLKMSDIPDDQAKLKGVVDGINEMILKNPFERSAA